MNSWEMPGYLLTDSRGKEITKLNTVLRNALKYFKRSVDNYGYALPVMGKLNVNHIYLPKGIGDEYGFYIKYINDNILAISLYTADGKRYVKTYAYGVCTIWKKITTETILKEWGQIADEHKNSLSKRIKK